MIILVLVLLLIGLVVASTLGWTSDSRDTDFGLGRLLAPRGDRPHQL